MQDRRGVERSMDGAPGDALGAAFAALEDETVLVGAPGVGEVRDAVTGEVRYRAPGAGGRLAARGSAWITRTHAGVVRVDPDATVEVVTPSRAESLLVWDDTTWIVGMPTGDVAILILRADGGSHAIARAPAPVGAYPDEAGWALAACDLDQDGQRELLVGAPGAGRVLRVDDLSVTTLSTANVLATGTGRFGAALACDRNTLWVGAPMAGTEAQGAVHAMRDGTVRLLFEGDATDAQLGFALHAADDVLVAGAPGASGTPGRALRILP
jgi:hypothetical protein